MELAEEMAPVSVKTLEPMLGLVLAALMVLESEVGLDCATGMA